MCVDGFLLSAFLRAATPSARICRERLFARPLRVADNVWAYRLAFFSSRTEAVVLTNAPSGSSVPCALHAVPRAEIFAGQGLMRVDADCGLRSANRLINGHAKSPHTP